MKRRTFCALTGGAVAFSAMPAPLRAFAATGEDSGPDIAAVQGGDGIARLDRSLEEFGGIRAFVGSGQSVVIKPNMGWAVPPSSGANTDPALVKRLAELCLQAGAAKVTCFDNPCDHWRDAYRESGIEAAVIAAGGVVAPPNGERYYRQVDLPAGVKLREAAVHEAWLEADVVFNMPVLKHHGGAGMTAALKNLMGVVRDRSFYHRNGLDQCIADFAANGKRPTLNIIDAGRVMLTGGPRGQSHSQYKRLDLLIVSPDIVAADVAAALSFGAKPEDFAYIGMAAKQGAGRGSLDGLDVRRIRIQV